MIRRINDKRECRQNPGRFEFTGVKPIANSPMHPTIRPVNTFRATQFYSPKSLMRMPFFNGVDGTKGTWFMAHPLLFPPGANSGNGYTSNIPDAGSINRSPAKPDNPIFRGSCFRDFET